MTPTTEPTTSAISSAVSDTDTVQPQALKIQFRYVMSRPSPRQPDTTSPVRVSLQNTVQSMFSIALFLHPPSCERVLMVRSL